ncbi:YheC/YheD family protein [Metabacillus litoralis]|uniref:YheC/YheD family protein n=1 Tax=Metabacillus litoralis TaxID=152268 RepID=A0A5C6W8L7_9BACI|nr:YheC/YheD family protein [Metabacillus litoralis]TXC92790.1 YheC/YheD family protein [Metabacillus litoralis]
MTKPYVGILLDGINYGGIKNQKLTYEQLSLYEEAAKHYGLIPCYFRLKDISEDCDYVHAYVMETGGKYEKRTLPVPTVIHNRALHFTQTAEEKIHLLNDKGISIFNNWNRFGKLKIHQILQVNEDIQPHLPETVRASEVNLHMMLKKYKDLIIKPNNNSLGSGVIKLAKVDVENWEMFFYKKQENTLHKEVFTTKDFPVILKRKINSKINLIQERIPLATYKGSPFDLRVSVQKNEKDKWQVTGIVGKVAQLGGHVTNVAKGGTCKTLEELVNELSLDYKTVYKNIEFFSEKVASNLAAKLPKLADLGLDIGMTNEGFPMFIEANCRDLRITFKNAGMNDVWKSTYFTPIGYAKYLYEHEIKEYD